MEKINPVPREPQSHAQSVSGQIPQMGHQPNIPDLQSPHRDFSAKKNSGSLKIANLAIALAVIAAGIVTGWFLAGQGSTQTSSDEGVQGTSRVNTQVDEELFPDTADGVLKKGGHLGEGTHYLDRGQGEEKNVYLTSTVIDLESFVGKKVQVRGKAISAQNVNYLMDVGTVKEVN